MPEYDDAPLRKWVRATVDAAYAGGPGPHRPPPSEASYGGSLPTEGGAPTLAQDILRSQASSGVVVGDKEPDHVDESERGEAYVGRDRSTWSGDVDAWSRPPRSDAADDATARAAAAWSALSAEDRAAIAAGDSELADRTIIEALSSDDAADDEPIRTGRDFVGYVLRAADSDGNVEMEDGSTLSVTDYLAAIADLSAAEWLAWAQEQGWDPEIRPAEMDWPRDMQSGRIADRFSDRLAQIEADKEARKLDPTRVVRYLE